MFPSVPNIHLRLNSCPYSFSLSLPFRFTCFTIHHVLHFLSPHILHINHEFFSQLDIKCHLKRYDLLLISSLFLSFYFWLTLSFVFYINSFLSYLQFTLLLPYLCVFTLNFPSPFPKGIIAVIARSKTFLTKFVCVFIVFFTFTWRYPTEPNISATLV